MRYLAIIFLVFFSCKDRSSQIKSVDDAENSLYWIKKLKYHTNGYRQPGAEDFFLPEAYRKKDPEAVVDEFMKSPRFVLTLMRFHLDYLDVVTDEVKNQGMEDVLMEHSSVAFQYPQSLAATYAFLDGSDYLDQLWHHEPRIPQRGIDYKSFVREFKRSPVPSEALSRGGFFERFRDRTTVTNFNRARAEKILNVYFCDDLSLDKAVLDDILKGQQDAHEEGQNTHESPTCFACHFRLDPIGAYFRYYNSDGSYYDGSEVRMANGTIDDIESYLKEWQNPEGNIVAGYAKSPKEIIDHGDDLEALFKVIRDPRLPETRQCLVKRAVQHFTSEGQVFDVEWLNDLAAEFDRTPNDTSAAMKRVIKRIFLSELYKNEDPKFDQCYDEMDKREDAPPCEIRYLVNEHCGECHSGEGGAFQSDKWVKGADGSYGFPNEKGLSGSALFSYLLKAIDEAKGVKKMPPGKDIPLDHKQALKNQLNRYYEQAYQRENQ